MSYLLKTRAPAIPRPKVRPARTAPQLLRRYRRPLAIACLLLALAAGLNVLAQGQLAQRQVVVASVDLPAGAILDAGDVQLRTLSVDPADAQLYTDVDALLGQRLAVALPAGTAVRDFLLVGPQLLTGSPAGTVAVPLRLSDAGTVSLLHPGQLVDIVLTTGDGFEKDVSSRLLARAVAVLWVPAAADQGHGGMFSSTSTPGDGLIVVAAPAGLSEELAGSMSRGQVSAVLVN